MAKKDKSSGVIGLVALITLAAVLTGGVVGFFRTSTKTGKQIEEWSRDLRLRERPTREPSSKIRLLGVTDDDLELLGQWPISRSNHAGIALILKDKAKVRHMTFDYLFTEASSDPDADTILADTFSGIPELTLAYSFEDLEEGGSPDIPHFATGSRYGVDVGETSIPVGGSPRPPFAKLADSYGAANAPSDLDDGVTRKIPLFMRHQGKLYPGLVMQSLINGLGLSEDQIRIQLGEFVEIVDTAYGLIRIPIDEAGRMRINFHCVLEDFHPAYNYTHLIGGNEDEKFGESIFADLDGKFVFVGNVATGSSDVVTTPLGRMPGVAVQALALSNILENFHLQIWPDWKTVLLCLFLAFLCFATLGWSKKIWVLPFLMTTALAGVLAWAHWQAGLGVLVPLTGPFATIALCGFGLLCSQIYLEKRARGMMKKSFRPYIATPLYHRLLQGSSGGSMTSERKQLSIFFSDIRGFTAWTEEREAEEITEVLNQYFATVIPIVEKHGGTLDKLMGDGLMAFFGAPEPIADHAAAAVRMAWDMQLEIARLQEKWKQEARFPLSVGMAVNTDFVTVGNFGSAEFSDYTVVGRPVNATARIESKAPGGRILITDKTKALAGEAIATEEFDTMNLKGVAQPVRVHLVTGVSDHCG